VDQIKGAMMSVCFKEGLKIDPQALREMIIASGQDVRQVMHNLSLWSATNKQMNTEEVQKAARNAKKNSKMVTNLSLSLSLSLFSLTHTCTHTLSLSFSLSLSPTFCRFSFAESI
jgi:DNA polymerase III delta prime subunit